MILEFSQNGYIRREFELRDTPGARKLVERLSRKTLGRGGWYWRDHRYSRFDRSSEWSMADIGACVTPEKGKGREE